MVAMICDCWYIYMYYIVRVACLTKYIVKVYSGTPLLMCMYITIQLKVLLCIQSSVHVYPQAPVSMQVLRGKGTHKL